ncbi:LysR family transcriptional regulator [Burkholderia cepacia JBK9]|uniref:LysR family transcriptional regulator n=1 Tax=Burkholderia arboris TaxID=488730 RepID=A0A9Q9SN92_9BURK|nr:LysR family transcriptional regulator [Burkholderia arboris]ALX16988.1 LysR family transcriptional regulator [Burkholderia cepacia JBK9]MCA8493621.1 LysR family transcriptional regulator [Burkholderia arboris]UTV59915.1 LysR family transcriptional regulator [Burkholderia arboris]VWC16054.1 LysR family transcriptional regulator [Burkholderia arboris]
MKDVFRQLDLNLLRVFATLMDERNVTRAAARLSLSQSAVSNALSRLRRSLDDTLFEKTTTGIRPTARAQELWAAMQPHFDALRQAISPDTFDPARFSGTFTLAMSDYTVERVMPRLAAYMGRYAPSMRISVVPYDLANLPNLFDRGGVDFAIGGYLNDANRSSGIRTHALWPIQWSCLMRKGHPLEKGALTLPRFLGAQHLDVLFPGTSTPLYDSILAAHSHRRNLLLTLPNYSPALAIIAQSDFIGVLPTSLLDLSPYKDSLISRRLPVQMPVRPYCMIWHQRWDSHAAHQWLRQSIASLFTQASPRA